MPGKKSPSNSIHIVRVYDAPLEAVWNAWTIPEETAKWWGPRGFTITHKSKDLRPGGTWVYTMHGPDGTDYPNITLYHEVIEKQKLVYDHGATEDSPPLFRVTALFSETDGKTTLEMTMAFSTAQVAEMMQKFIKDAGGNATWDRLAEYLDHEATGRERFVINRSFAAPREVVFDAWTKPEQLAKWLPPAGLTMRFLRVDVRPGGTSFYAMSNDAGLTMYGRCEYQRIERPVRLAYIQQFCDEHEQLSRHPMAPTWPSSMLTTIDFAEEGPDETRVTVTMEPFGDTTPEELATFIAGRSGMTLGWTGSFDKLDAAVESANLAMTPG